MNTFEQSHYIQVPSSFRDPVGSVFQVGDTIIRSIMPSYEEHWDAANKSGFIATCIEEKLIPDFMEISPLPGTWKTLSVERIPYISYPYEWSFSQLKQAALLTLKLQKKALVHELILKDASAYNVQFIGACPIFIDLLSFEKYTEGKAWQAYAQFCEHFLAPLLLMSKISPEINKILASYLDGVPLNVAKSMLPWASRFNLSINMHIFMHAKSQEKHSDSRISAKKMYSIHVSKKTLLNLVDSLENLILHLSIPDYKTAWGDYYNDTNYNSLAFSAKHEILDNIVRTQTPKTILDLGANNGEFSYIASKYADYVLSPDIDPIAVHTHHQNILKEQNKTILPMLLDISNPSPAIGWNNKERLSFIERTHVETCQALALIHHLAIGNNTPLPLIADFFAKICDFLLLEFVPKEDSQVIRMMSAREDIFPNYHLTGCLDAFNQHFNCLEQIKITNSERTLLVMKKNIIKYKG